MNKNKSLIQWELVFLIHEFKKCLFLKDIIELSLLSKMLRIKLKPLIFTCIELNLKKLSNRRSCFVDKEDQLPVINRTIIEKFLNFSLVSNNEDDFKVTKIDPFINSIESEFSTNCQYSKVIRLVNLGKPCFYIFPLISFFNNLTQLKVVKCNISIKDFNTCTDGLKNIEILELVNAEFIEIVEGKSIIKGIKLPDSIKELSWFDNIVASSFNQSSAYDFLSKRILMSSTKFDPPAANFPELKRLKYPFNARHPRFLIAFLQNNPQLASISLPFDNINNSHLKYLSINTTITEFWLDFKNISLLGQMSLYPTLPCIKTLVLLNFNMIQYESVRNLIISCTNLLKLTFVYTPPWSNNNNFIYELKLKYPELEIESKVMDDMK
jgi:hypothetical protein